MRLWNGLMATCLGMTACGDSGPSQLDSLQVGLQTDPEYALSAVGSGYEVVVYYRIINSGSESAYVPSNCLDDYRLDAERLTEGVWALADVSFYGQAIADCGVGNRVEILPGESVDGELILSSKPGVTPEALYGAYRLVLPELVDASERNLGPLRSAVFTVARAEGGS